MTQNYSVLSHPEVSSGSETAMTQNYSHLNGKELELMSLCNKYNVEYHFPTENETRYEQKKRMLMLKYRIKCKKIKFEESSNALKDSSDPNQICENNISNQDTNTHNTYLDGAEKELLSVCRKLGVTYDQLIQNETKYDKNRRKRRIKCHFNTKKCKLQKSHTEIPDPPPPLGDTIDKVLDCIRAFELQEMSYQIQYCEVCHERILEMKMSSQNVCLRCNSDKNCIKIFSAENNMVPKPTPPPPPPPELASLSIIEQQLISRISPCINVHLLNYGGIASNGHCVTFPQEINEPAIFFLDCQKRSKLLK